MKVGSQTSGWEAFQADRLERRDAATDPALKSHFEAELEVARVTLEAMGAGGTSEAEASPETPLQTEDDIKQPPAAHDTTEGSESVNYMTATGAFTSRPHESDPLSDTLNPELEPYRDAIQQASDATGVPANLIAAVIWDESKGIANAGSTNGENGMTDFGLMQINPETFAALKSGYPDLLPGDATDPLTHITAGALYLKENFDSFGSWDLALRAYNSGPGSVDPSDPSISTTGFGTKNYVEKVNFYVAQLEQGNTMPDGFPGGNVLY